jgi:hypothetical protein
VLLFGGADLRVKLAQQATSAEPVVSSETRPG